MNTVGKKLLILAGVLILMYLLAEQLGRFYVYFFPQPIGHGSLLSAPIPRSGENFLIGLPLSYSFFLPLLFTAFGGSKRYWWIGILLLPAAAFEVYFDLAHIYVPVALGFLGWTVGFSMSKAVLKEWG